jgi:hypothetical protein
MGVTHPVTQSLVLLLLLFVIILQVLISFDVHDHCFMVGEWESGSGLGAPGKQDRGYLDCSGVPKLS